MSSSDDLPSILAGLRQQLERTPWDGKLAARFIGGLTQAGELAAAQEVFAAFQRTNRRPQMVLPHLALARLLLDLGHAGDAATLLKASTPHFPSDIAEAGNLLMLAGDSHAAAHLLLQVDPTTVDDPRQLAPMGVSLWKSLEKLKGKELREAVKRHAVVVYRRTIEVAPLDKTRGRVALNLAEMLARLHADPAEIDEAFQLALRLSPRNEKARDAYERWRSNQARKAGQRLGANEPPVPPA